jgi:hypothetical protein
MHVELDGKVLNIPQTTLGEALRAARDVAEASGMLIVEVIADGKRLGDDELSHVDNQTFADIRMFSVSPGSLVERSLRDASGVVEQIAELQQEVVSLIQRGQTREGLEQLQSVFSSWSAVREVVDQGGQILGIDLLAADAAGTQEHASGAACAAGLAASLTEIKRALADQDWSALSDVVGYQLDGLAGNWKAMLDARADAIGRSSPGGRSSP